MAHNERNIELRLENLDVLSAATAAELANAFFDQILYQRRQIPFSYKTYKYFIEKWDENDAAEGEAAELKSLHHYQLKQQRSKAKATKESIGALRELIRQAFKCSVVKQIRFLFGNTIFMPMEAYTLHLPHETITRLQHYDLTDGRINQTLVQLMACEELSLIFCSEMNVTNMFLELELLNHTGLNTGLQNHCKTMKMFPKDVLSQLPRSCKNIHLHLLYDHKTRPATELAIFQDLELLKLDKSTSDMNADADNRTLEQTSSWWQAESIVRGFKASNQKSFDLWSI